ncbi:hypothetical protein [Streptomyces fildesensis]|uniref:hypothetical protein n=1 Tax=Streptomyces fildesensis TaxID=375757 RepID=UPI0018DF6441|nr:hypothetical protein [Streptomyces fildesensis]
MDLARGSEVATCAEAETSWRGGVQLAEEVDRGWSRAALGHGLPEPPLIGIAAGSVNSLVVAELMEMGDGLSQCPAPGKSMRSQAARSTALVNLIDDTFGRPLTFRAEAAPPGCA